MKSTTKYPKNKFKLFFVLTMIINFIFGSIVFYNIAYSVDYFAVNDLNVILGNYFWSLGYWISSLLMVLGFIGLILKLIFKRQDSNVSNSLLMLILIYSSVINIGGMFNVATFANSHPTAEFLGTMGGLIPVIGLMLSVVIMTILSLQILRMIVKTNKEN